MPDSNAKETPAHLSPGQDNCRQAVDVLIRRVAKEALYHLVGGRIQRGRAGAGD
jgi:hypothetical protein